MMAAAAVDMNVTIISMNLDILEQQRGHMLRAVDQYVDKVIGAGRQWTTRRERNQSTFLEIHKITSKAMAFLSMKCDEIKSELESETSDHIGRDEFTQQQENAQADSTDKPVTPHGNGKEDDTDDVKQTHTFTNPNLESDQQTRYQDIYNQLNSVLAKQDDLEQQLNMKLNNLREDTESLKSDVGTFNQYVETGKGLLKDYSQKVKSLENVVSCLSGNVKDIYSDQQVLFDRINSHLSDKDDQVITDLSAKVDQITTDLAVKVDQFNKNLSTKVSEINTELSDKVDEINTDISAKVDEINVVLQSLTNSEKEHAAQVNKIIDLEKQFNTIEKDTQNNDKQVQQRLDEVRKKLLDVTQKVTFLSATVSTCAKKNDLGAVGFNATATLQDGCNADSVVGMFEPLTFSEGFEFDSYTGMFTACSGGIYLAYVSMYLYQDGYSRVDLIRKYTEYGNYDDPYEEEVQVCMLQTDKKLSTECSVNIIRMEAGDNLFIRTHEYPIVNFQIQLLCFKIG